MNKYQLKHKDIQTCCIWTIFTSSWPYRKHGSKLSPKAESPCGQNNYLPIQYIAIFKGYWVCTMWESLRFIEHVLCESPLDCKEIQLVHPKEISPAYSLEGLMLKLKLQYFGHLMRRTDSLGKTLMLAKLKAGEEGDDRGWYGWMASLTQWTWVWVNSRSWWWTGRPGVLHSIGSQRVRHDGVTELSWSLTGISATVSSFVFQPLTLFHPVFWLAYFQKASCHASD